MSRVTPKKSYMPKSDVGKKMWMENFLAGIDGSEDHFGLSDQRHEYLTRIIRQFTEALAVSSNKGERNMVSVANKNAARKRAVEECRSLAMQLKADPSISTGEKIVLGLHRDDKLTTRVPRPDRSPTLTVVGAASGGHIIRYTRGAIHRTQGETDLNLGDVSAKPRGTTHLLLFAAITDDGKGSKREARFIGAYTRQPITVDWPNGSGVDGR